MRIRIFLEMLIVVGGMSGVLIQAVGDNGRRQEAKEFGDEEIKESYAEFLAHQAVQNGVSLSEGAHGKAMGSEIASAAGDEVEAVVFQDPPQAPSIEIAKVAVESATKEAKIKRMRARNQELMNKLGKKYVRNVPELEAAERGEEVADTQLLTASTRTLLVFFDDSECFSMGRVSAITSDAIAALCEKAGPMVISRSLLNYIFHINGQNYLEKFFYSADTKKLLEAFYTIFDATRWAIYRSCDEFFFVLIPLENFNLETSVADFNIVGLEKITVDGKDSLHVYFNKKCEDVHLKKVRHQRLWGTDQVADLLLAFLKQLLRRENQGSVNVMPQKYMEEAPQWVIYLAGHGEYGKSIAGFSIQKKYEPSFIGFSMSRCKSQFQQLLEFFDKKIKMKLFVYRSCYAAGLNAYEAYAALVDKDKIKSETVYSFPIVTGTLADVPICCPQILAKDNGDMFSEIKYQRFVNAVSEDTINYSLALGFIFPLIDRGALSSEEMGSVPQIRPAHGSAWFPLNGKGEKIMRIGKVMAQTRTEPLIVKRYRGEPGLHSILLATETIPFPIVIDDVSLERAPSFISGLPGKAKHVISSLEYKMVKPSSDTTADYLIGYILDDIVGDIGYGVSKQIAIKALRFVDTEGGGEFKTFRDVSIEGKTGNAFCYTEGGVLHYFGKPKNVGDVITRKVHTVANLVAQCYRTLNAVNSVPFVR